MRLGVRSAWLSVVETDLSEKKKSSEPSPLRVGLVKNAQPCSPWVCCSFLLFRDASKVPGGMDWVVSGLSQGDWQETSLGPVCMGSACEAWVLSSRFLSIYYSFFWMGRLLAGCIMLHVLILPCSLQLCMTSWFFLEHLNCDLLNFRVQEEQKKEAQID